MKKTLPWLILLLGIAFSTIAWKYISLPYDETNLIVGEYSLKNINPINDSLRGIFFIFFPLFLYLIVYLIQNRELFTTKIFKNKKSIKNKNIEYLSLIIILFSILEFYSLDYNYFISELDTHHEGTFLTAQLNVISKNKFWSGTFFDYGFLGNSIGIFFNYLFNDYSIGIQRYSFKLLILINKIFLILICRKIIICLNETNKKEFLFLVFTLSSLTLVSFYEPITPFHSRIFLFLIFTFLVFNIVCSEKNNLIINLFIGSFSVFSILFYWDIGTYINVLLIILIIFLLFVKRFIDFYQISFGLILSWSMFFVLVPNNEFKELINQYLFIINISDYLLGIEYPEPFSTKSTRHTKALLLIILAGVFLINYIFNINRNESLQSKFLLFFLFISSIIFFKSGLMRSDTPHIKYTSGVYTLLVFFFISYYCVKIANNIQIFNKFFIFFEKRKIFLIVSSLICFLFIFKNNYLNLLYVFDSEKNFQKITKINDSRFLDNDYSNFLNIFKDLIKDEKCVQQFTDDNAIPYLVNKPTCTKYFVNAHIIQNWTEDNFIKELKDTKPNFIVYSSKINWFKDRNNAPNADKYIQDSYSLFKDLSPWTIYKKN
tara:strand:- start:212 stop:2017 length:1806 start_codon:yes stop_codon:yes gene_type:complete